MNQPKFCKDCEHALWDGFSFRCVIAAPVVDVVNGQSRMRFCEVERADDMGCGREGKFWEPKEKES